MKKGAKRWPIGISLAILAIFFAAIATVIVAIKNPVQEIDTYMRSYHEGDANINELISDKIHFDKKYTIVLLTKQIDDTGTVLVYHLSDKAGNPVNNAEMKVVWTRPDVRDYDMTQENPVIKEGDYSFEKITLPKQGRWNIMLSVKVGDNSRYYNLKADTRNSYTQEYGY